MPPPTNSVPAGGEYAANININTSNGVMTLQNAISTNINLLKNLLLYQWIVGSWSSNGVCPTTTWTRTVYCQRSDGANMGTTCGIYSGCDCPTPATSTTTTCTWVQNSGTCGCGSIYGNPICGGIQDCNSLPGAACSSSGSWQYCVSGSCVCGSFSGITTCSSSNLYTITCTINSP